MQTSHKERSHAGYGRSAADMGYSAHARRNLQIAGVCDNYASILMS